jgi:hypothetical protein
MGFVFDRGTPIAAGFRLRSPISVDVFSVVETRQDLNSPNHPTAPGVFEEILRFVGRTVFVVAEGREYWLRQGLGDEHWELKGGSETPIIPVWASGVEYLEGEIIWHEGQLWRVKTTHTAGTTFEMGSFDAASADLYSNTNPTTMTFGQIQAGRTFDNYTFGQFIEEQMYPHVPPNVNFTVNPAAGLREIGTQVDNLVLTAVYTQTKFPVAKVEFFDGTTLLEDATINNPAGDTINHTVGTITGTENKTYRVVVTDAHSDPMQQEVARTFSFVNPVFIGSVDASMTADTITEADITGLSTIVANAKALQTYSHTVNNGRFVLWAPTEGWGTPTRISDPNGFNITDSFIGKEISITNKAGTVVPGFVFVLDTPTTQTNFAVTYSWS